LKTSVDWGKNWQYRRSDFSEKIAKEMEKNSSKDSESSKKEARHSIRCMRGQNYYWFMNPSERIFTCLSSMPNFNAKGKGAAENILSPIEKWSLLFFNYILNIILKYFKIYKWGNRTKI